MVSEIDVSSSNSDGCDFSQFGAAPEGECWIITEMITFPHQLKFLGVTSRCRVANSYIWLVGAKVLSHYILKYSRVQTLTVVIYQNKLQSIPIPRLRLMRTAHEWECWIISEIHTFPHQLNLLSATSQYRVANKYIWLVGAKVPGHDLLCRVANNYIFLVGAKVIVIIF
jgi:hypothetical protein